MDALALAARILFVMVFLSSGLLGHLGPGRSMLTQFAAARKIPSPGFLVPFSGLWIVVGSLSVLLGIYGDVGALMIALFVAATALFMHPYWKENDEQAKMQEQVQFSKDLALAGGALALFVVGTIPSAAVIQYLPLDRGMSPPRRGTIQNLMESMGLRALIAGGFGL